MKEERNDMDWSFNRFTDWIHFTLVDDDDRRFFSSAVSLQPKEWFDLAIHWRLRVQRKRSDFHSSWIHIYYGCYCFWVFDDRCGYSCVGKKSQKSEHNALAIVCRFLFYFVCICLRLIHLISHFASDSARFIVFYAQNIQSKSFH